MNPTSIAATSISASTGASSGINVNSGSCAALVLALPPASAIAPGDSLPILSTMASAGALRVVRSCSFCALSRLQGTRSLTILGHLLLRVRQQAIHLRSRICRLHYLEFGHVALIEQRLVHI